VNLKWEQCELGTVVTLQRGHDLPSQDREHGIYPIVSSSGITDHHNCYKAKAPGVVTGRYGTLGEVFYLDCDYWPLNTTLYVKDFKGNHPRWVFYLLRSLNLKDMNIAGAVPGINRNHLHKLNVELPPLQTQQRIAGILSAYDNLIENNLRRIKLLEEMAQITYEEWFVRLRFPGYESIPLVKSSIGNIPENWTVCLIRDLCESVSYGFTASASQTASGPRFLRITDIVQTHIDWWSVPRCSIEESKLDKYILRHGDIVVARTGATTGYAKRLNKRHPTSIFASYLVRMRPRKDVSNIILGILMESDSYKQFVHSNIGGAAQPQANAQVLSSLKVCWPSKNLQARFDEFVEPLQDQVEILLQQNDLLREARDILLPRLMTGMIDAESYDPTNLLMAAA
jgi:type I restriction enzyme S subunit